MIKNHIKRYIMKRKGCVVDKKSIVQYKGIKTILNDSNNLPKIIDSVIVGSILIEDGCIIDSARIYGDVSIHRYANINGPGTVIEGIVDKIEIGAFSSIGMNTTIISHNHRIDRASTYRIMNCFFNETYENDLIGKGNIIIEEDVWVGAGCVILGGVRIQRGSIIGAGSIVTHDIPPYSIATGAPAKVIKKRFSEITIKELNETKWWLWSETEIKKNKDFFAITRE